MLGYAAVSATKNRRRQGSKGEELPSCTMNDKSLAIFRDEIPGWNGPMESSCSSPSSCSPGEAKVMLPKSTM